MILSFLQGFTALPIMVIALLDQDVSSQTRLRKPDLYNKGDRYSYKVVRLLM